MEVYREVEDDSASSSASMMIEMGSMRRGVGDALEDGVVGSSGGVGSYVEREEDTIHIREAPSEDELRDRKKKMSIAIIFVIAATIVLAVGGFFSLRMYNDRVDWVPPEDDNAPDSPYYKPNRENGANFCNLLKQLPPSRWNASRGQADLNQIGIEGRMLLRVSLNPFN